MAVCVSLPALHSPDPPEIATRPHNAARGKEKHRGITAPMLDKNQLPTRELPGLYPIATFVTRNRIPAFLCVHFRRL